MAYIGENVSNASYFRQAEEIHKSNVITSRIDKQMRDTRQTSMLTNNNNVIPVSGFKQGDTVSIWNRSLAEIRVYDENTTNPIADADVLQAEQIRFKIATAWYINERAGVINMMHNPVLNLMNWLRDEVHQKLNPAIDALIFATLTSHITGNNFVTTHAAGTSFYFALLDALEAYKKRTDHAASKPILLVPAGTWTEIMKDDKFTRDNFLSQRNERYKGVLGTIAGMPVAEVSENRFGTTYKAILCHRSVLAWANPLIQTRTIRKPANFFGSLIQLLTMNDAYTPPYQGVACQGIKNP